MEFFREARGDGHLRGITGVLKTSGSEIASIDCWAARLGLGYGAA